ncbi:uncharacterized protein LOC117540267 [Gymnodraco acuticeps]|uniref:Uncharacterized protein LOC117540267 n=1 Tax=Gymnodraco acuticeps TaxID=8218 RepID=A0A6P8TFN6_GYMAC|nr:uncharacterized protein LOC117540267 [Gymnodraco acuticeps]XP_034062750.1 uncharacterized protein LOC117540267 [Gymnodraco acuticeps]XP_034062751.1 uncharacterized protein LOC117540267 [Gymnodraco acuticeps]
MFGREAPIRGAQGVQDNRRQSEKDGGKGRCLEGTSKTGGRFHACKEKHLKKPREETGERASGQLPSGRVGFKKKQKVGAKKRWKTRGVNAGTYRVVDIEGKVVEIVSEKGTNKMKVNIDHLAHYVQPEERIPAKLNKLLDPSPLADPLTSTSSQTLAPSTRAEGASSEVETLIRDIWAGRRKETLWAKYGPYKVYSENLMVLAPGQQLEGELDLTKHNVAAGAVCHKAHWTLIIMCLRENRSLFLDPFGATKEQISRCKDLTRSLVRKTNPAVGHATAWIIPNSRTQHHVVC